MHFLRAIALPLFIQFVALITLSMSIILLVVDLVDFVKMPTTARVAILTSFVVSVLGSAASVGAQAWVPDQNTLAVRILLLDEAMLSSLTGNIDVRPRRNYVKVPCIKELSQTICKYIWQ
jgi:hypothetical protein